MSAASLVRWASGTRPSRKYGPRSHPSPLPPSQALSGPRSPQNSSRCPLRPCACKRSCSSSQPFGITLPSGRALNALGWSGLRLATGAPAVCAPGVATAASANIDNRDRRCIASSVPISKPECKLKNEAGTLTGGGLVGQLGRVPSGSGRLSIGPLPRWQGNGGGKQPPRRLTTQCHSFLPKGRLRSEEHTSELQSLRHLVCRLLLEKKTK